MAAKTLEETLRALAAKGELNYLSVIPRAGKGGVVFSVAYAPASACGQGFGSNVDPVAAILEAIANWKPRRKPAAPIDKPEPRQRRKAAPGEEWLTI